MRRFPELALAQVEALYPDQFELGVALPNYGSMHGIRVRIAALLSGPVTGEYGMPRVGEFGIVAFYADDANAGVWLANVPSRLWSAEPRELLQDDPRTTVKYHRDGAREVHYGNGDQEFIYPDGTLLRLTASKDETVSNTGSRSLRTRLQRTVDADPGKVSREQQREEYTPPLRPPLDIRLEHSSGAIVTITADGNFRLTTPAGHSLKLHDATEKSRDADGGVLSTPEEDASRVASEVVLESEIGHRVILHDDPVLLTDRRITIQHAGGHEITMKDDPIPQSDKRVTVRTAAGHQLEMRDLPADNMYVRVETAAGHQFELRDTPGTDVYVSAQTTAGNLLELRDAPTVVATVATPGGRSIQMDDTAGETTITDPVQITVDAPIINLAGGGPAVARVGDAVAAGVIVGGSSKVFSG